MINIKSINFNNVDDALKYISDKEEYGYVLFSSVDNVKKLSNYVSEKVVLCSTAGEYTDKGYKNGVISGFEYKIDEAKIEEILYPPAKSVKALKSAYKEIEKNKNAFILLLCDGLSGMEETIMTSLYFIDDKFKIIGGSAGDNLAFKETYVFIGRRKVHSAAIFFNLNKKIHMLKENIYVPMGKRLLITEADTINRKVISFNNVPASTEYAKALGIAESKLSDSFMNNPLGKIYEDDIYIASPMKVNPDKSITFYCQMVSNTFVQVLQPADPITIIKDTVKNVPFKPSFVFAVNCILRSLKFEQEHLWSDIDREILKLCPNVSGFISYGEQFYKMHSNQTMVMLLVE